MKTRFVYTPKSTHNSKLSQTGFTIVELLVVIVVIAILAAITIVSYTGITGKAIASSLQSDLDNNSKLLKMYYADYGSYPTSIDTNYCPVPADSKYCLKTSNSNTLTYTNLLGTSFKLIATKNTTSYYITSDTSPNNKNLLYLLTGDNASFEDGGVGSWWPGTWNGYSENSNTWSAHGNKSYHFIGGFPGTYIHLDITTLTSAGSTYTARMKIKNEATNNCYIALALADNTGENISSNPQMILPGQEGYLTVTRTFGSSSTWRHLQVRSYYDTYQSVYFDAIQLETGSVATPF